MKYLKSKKKSNVRPILQRRRIGVSWSTGIVALSWNWFPSKWDYMLHYGVNFPRSVLRSLFIGHFYFIWMYGTWWQPKGAQWWRQYGGPK